MVEALGREYWPTFMDCVARNLKPGGRAAIQYISMQDELFDAYAKGARVPSALADAVTVYRQLVMLWEKSLLPAVS